MRTIHIVFETPLPTGSGAHLRNLSIKASLLAQGPSSVIAVQPLLPDPTGYPERRRSFIEAELPEDVQMVVLERVTQAAPDICIVEGVFLSQIADRLSRAGFCVIIDMHNVESALLEEIDRARYGWRAALLRRRWALARAADQQLARRIDQVWMCSSRDAAAMQALTNGQASVSVVPNPTPSWCTAVQPSEQGEMSALHALFVGHLGYAPNIEATRRLVTGIFPGILALFPAAKLEISGRSPHPKLMKFFPNQPEITLVADPVDLAPAYARANVALIPLSTGGGTRLKVLEAMAVGVPVVATAKAVEGLDVVPGQTFLQAETDVDFVAAVKLLANDPALCTRLIDAGRVFVSMHHSQNAIDTAVHAALQAHEAQAQSET